MRHTGHTQSPQQQAVTTRDVWLPGKPIRHSVSKTLMASWSRAPIPSAQKPSCVGINHIIHTNNLGSVIHHYHIGNGGNPTKIRVPRPQGQEYLLQYLLSHCFLICDTEKFGIGSGGEMGFSRTFCQNMLV